MTWVVRSHHTVHSYPSRTGHSKLIHSTCASVIGPRWSRITLQWIQSHASRWKTYWLIECRTSSNWSQKLNGDTSLDVTIRPIALPGGSCPASSSTTPGGQTRPGSEKAKIPGRSPMIAKFRTSTYPNEEPLLRPPRSNRSPKFSCDFPHWIGLSNHSVVFPIEPCTRRPCFKYTSAGWTRDNPLSMASHGPRTALLQWIQNCQG